MALNCLTYTREAAAISSVCLLTKIKKPVYNCLTKMAPGPFTFPKYAS